MFPIVRSCLQGVMLVTEAEFCLCLNHRYCLLCISCYKPAVDQWFMIYLTTQDLDRACCRNSKPQPEMFRTDSCSVQVIQPVGMYFSIKFFSKKRKRYSRKCTQAHRLAILHESFTLAAEYRYTEEAPYLGDDNRIWV